MENTLKNTGIRKKQNVKVHINGPASPPYISRIVRALNEIAASDGSKSTRKDDK